MLRIRTSTRRRLVVGVTTAAAGLLTLSGCFRIDMAMTIHSDDTIDATMIAAVNQSVLSMTGSTVDDLFPDSSVDGSTSAPYSDGELVGKTFTIKNQPLSKFNEGKDDGTGTMTVAHVNDTYVVDGTLDFSSGSTDETSLSMLKSGTVKVAFTFPGKITDANGQIDAKTNTVTWQPSDPTQALTMHAVGKDAPENSIAPWMLYGGGGLVLLVIVGAVVLVAVCGCRSSRVSRVRRSRWPGRPAAVCLPC